MLFNAANLHVIKSTVSVVHLCTIRKLVKRKRKRSIGGILLTAINMVSR